MSGPGALVIVGTPIGNLGDLSPRAVEALSTADTIGCEDTRRTGLLLKHIGAPKCPFVVVNEHTEFVASATIVQRVLDGQRVVLVSDAGMPLVSDPGGRIVRDVIGAGGQVDVVPGPTAVSTALVLSGIDARRFVFEGFIPRKGSDRAAVLAEIANSTRTVVLYESPHRVAKTLADLVSVCGPERQVAVARELTKLHQDVWRGTVGDALVHVDDAGTRGEYVLVIEAAPLIVTEVTDDDIVAALTVHLGDGLSARDATAEVVGQFGVAKRRVYSLATELRS